MTDVQKYMLRYTLQLGDNAWILSHRLSEWCSNGPFLEEDLAMTNIALDLIGRAQGLYRYAAQLDGSGKTEDDFAYRRNERQYYNNLLVELPNGDFANTMVRQLFVSVFEFYFFSKLQESKDETLAAIAAKTLKEVRYHMAHASDWVVRLGDGTDESHQRTQDAVDALWMFTNDMFDMDNADHALVADGIGVDLIIIKQHWESHISKVLQEATISLPGNCYMQTGSKNGVHTEYLGHILGEMQFLQRAYPDAKW